MQSTCSDRGRDLLTCSLTPSWIFLEVGREGNGAECQAPQGPMNLTRVGSHPTIDGSYDGCQAKDSQLDAGGRYLRSLFTVM